ncbi:hypothetical protein KFL_001380050 [Klebsormidium nitens]|uniref:DUF4057 domain-containing protein n=1 Tax=Klebsormidium nitens TaxID=105231 RepID=A0A1Y1HWY0_KLENI|nr:hypothetical protein KFL_001380050 [Klebsormidium nitens]|eukprot:GAQ83164.1 hypothetical protein KFL_001380050 [Klebsormidium nitens]
MAEGTIQRRLSIPPGGDQSINLFDWSESSGPPTPDTITGVRRGRGTSPGSGSKIVFGDEKPIEHETIPTRPGSAQKHKELSGSGIFDKGPHSESSNAFANNNDQNNGNYITDRPSTRVQQPAGGISQISLGGGYDTTPEKVPAHKLAKFAEIRGNMEEELQKGSPGEYLGRPSSEKKKELLDSKVFGPAPPFRPSIQPLAQAHAGENDHIFKIWRDEEKPSETQTQGPAVGGTSQVAFGDDGPVEAVAKKLHDSKLAELSGNNIFDDGRSPGPSIMLSDPKRKELGGNDIFCDAVPPKRDLMGAKNPPGGPSTISLV